MSIKVRASICNLIESILYGSALNKALKNRKQPKKDGEILIALLDSNLMFPLAHLSALTPVEQGDQMIRIISLYKHEISSHAILSFSYNMRGVEDCPLNFGTHEALAIGHIHIKDYVKYITHFDSSLVRHVVLQVNSSMSDFCFYLSQIHANRRKHSTSTLNDSSFCTANNSLLSSSLSICSSLGDSGNNSHLSTYLIQPCGNEDVKITRSLIRSMEMYWSNRVGSSFRRTYHSSSARKIWIAVERNTAVLADDNKSTFEIDGVTWCIVS